jgi:hypothetical protein
MKNQVYLTAPVIQTTTHERGTKVILEYLENYSLPIEKKQQWKELINPLKSRDIKAEIHSITNKDDLEKFQTLCNQNFHTI